MAITTYTPATHRPAAAGGLLSLAQMAALAGIGAVLWMVAVSIIRFGPPDQFDGASNGLGYAVTTLVTLPVIWATRRIVGAAKVDTLLIVNITSFTACFLDGIAFGWFRGLYGAHDQHYLAGAAAWLLWAIGSAQLLAHVIAARARSDEAA